jgi:glycosyltransferase involved in cell wall biosynthesis
MAQRTRIVFAMPDLGGGGAQRVMLSLARGLDRSAFDLHLVVIGRNAMLASEVLGDVAVHRLDAARLRSALPEIIKLLRRLRPRLVLSVMSYINLALLAARPLLPSGTRILVREANVLEPAVRALPRWLPAAAAYRLLYPLADAVIAPTSIIAEQIKNIAPRAAPRINVIPNPVLADVLQHWATPPARPSGGGLVLVGAGRLTPQKGFDRLIELMPKLPSDARLTIFGEGPDRAALQGRAAALGLNDRIAFRGFDQKLAAAIAGADLFLLPSRWEGLPNVVLESLSLGTPVVASEESGVQEIAREAPAGAVSIAPVDDFFVDAILRQPRAVAPISAPRASLLPARYEASAVTSRFVELFNRVAA